MRKLRPGPLRFATRALARDLRDEFDRRARCSLEGFATELGLTIHQVNSLMYGGTARSEIVERAENAMRGRA